MSIHVRKMTKADFERVVQLYFEAFTSYPAKHGFPPRIQSQQEAQTWAWAMSRHAGTQVFVAELDNRTVGACCLNPRGTLAGIGPMAVDPSLQSRGIGLGLLTAMVELPESLGNTRAIMEGFNRASFSMCYAAGFMPVADLLELLLPAGAERNPQPCDDVTQASVSDLPMLCAYDSPRSTLDRSVDFAYYARWGKILICRRHSEIRGFLACLPSPASVQMGPLVAEDEDTAAILYRNATALYPGRACRTFIMARDNSLARGVMASGFKLYCANFLIVRGAWRPSRYVEAFGIFPEGV